ncbi:MAG: hypothetical protein ABEH65_05650 [Halobacteriales archaeon]
MLSVDDLTGSDRRFLSLSVPIAAFIGGLCCFTPVVVVLLGLGSVSYAIALTDLLYYEFRWVFQLAGLTFIVGAVGVYFYTNEGVCSVDAVVRKRRKILNLLGVALLLAVFGYVIWLYVIVEFLGLLLGIW